MSRYVPENSRTSSWKDPFTADLPFVQHGTSLKRTSLLFCEAANTKIVKQEICHAIVKHTNKLKDIKQLLLSVLIGLIMQ